MPMFNPFKKSFNEKELEQFAFLKSVKCFEKLNEEELHLLLPTLNNRLYKKDEAVFFRNDPSQAVYIIKSGFVSININREDKFEILTTAGEREAFGDNAFISNTNRIYNAVVTSDEAELLVLPQGNILEIFESNPKLKAKVLESLVEQYNDYTLSLFEAYKSSFGFFELKQAYSKVTSTNS